MPILTLLTDFGTRDWYVAAMKGVVLVAAGDVTLVDITHDLAPGDVEGGAFFLGAVRDTFPAGTVHLAVVDPGVGTGRHILAGEEAGARFVGPDNGLLTPFLRPGAQVVAVDRPDVWRSAPGATFHGRDRFAPVAAALLRGTPLAELGPELDEPIRLDLPPPRRGDDVLRGRVAHVDRFGNLVSDVPAAWLARGRPFVVEVRSDGPDSSAWRVEQRVRTYAEIPEGEAAVLVGSLGTLEISLRGRNLADAWNVGRGTELTIKLHRSSLPKASSP